VRAAEGHDGGLSARRMIYHEVMQAYHPVIYTSVRMVASAARAPTAGTRLDYRALADLRYQIRRFLRVREVAARAAGVEPQQYLVLLQIKGLQGHEVATMSVLAERLQVRHHAAVQLVDRLASAGMVERRRDGADRREVVVRLRPAGERVLKRLAGYSLAELTREGPSLVASLDRLVMQSTRGRVPSRNGTRKASR
jgi:DNA-binding MarR family transcriptional regulator